MTKDELFKKAWLFLYAAAGENIGFDVRPAEDKDPYEGEELTDQTA